MQDRTAVAVLVIRVKVYIINRRERMLVLSRRPTQRIIIDDRIAVEVIEIRGDKVRIGVTADADVPIDREEVWIQKQQLATTGSESDS